ncbi:MAG: hypothetical protein ACPG7F_21390, partial [Aggregatilineales bacterium]
GTTFLFDYYRFYLTEEQLKTDRWYQIDVSQPELQISTVSEVQFFQQQLDLTGAEIRLSDGVTQIPPLLDVRPGSAVALAYVSPNGRYRAYPAEGVDGRGAVALLDIQENDFILLTEILIASLSSPDAFRVDWSADSSAFTVRRVSDFAADDLFYISNFSKNVRAATVEQVMEFNVDGQNIGVAASRTALSSNGNVLLFVGGFQYPLSITIADLTGKNERINLVLYKTDTIVKGITFSEDNQRAFFIDGTGLQQIDLESGEVTVLDARINTEWVSRAYFSPNGRHVAILGGMNVDGGQWVYVLDVPQ